MVRHWEVPSVARDSVLVSALPPEHPEPGEPVQVDAPPGIGKRFFQKRTLISFAFAFAMVFLAVRSWKVTPEQLGMVLARTNIWIFLLALAVYASSFPCRGLRWKLMLNNVGMDAGVVPLSITILLSWFVNCVVPAKLGDIYRAYLMRKNEHLPVSATLGTIFSERIIDFTFLFFILLVSGAFALQHKFTAQIGEIMGVSFVFIALLGVTLLVMRFHGKRIVGLFSGKVQDVYHRFSHGTFASFQGNRAAIALLTILAWSGEIGRLWLVTKAVGVDLPLSAILFALAGVSFSLIVPTPGGLGAAELVLAFLMNFFGVPMAVATGIALLDRLISYWALVISGLGVYLLSKRTR